LVFLLQHPSKLKKAVVTAFLISDVAVRDAETE